MKLVKLLQEIKISKKVIKAYGDPRNEIEFPHGIVGALSTSRDVCAFTINNNDAPQVIEFLELIGAPYKKSTVARDFSEYVIPMEYVDLEEDSLNEIKIINGLITAEPVYVGGESDKYMVEFPTLELEHDITGYLLMRGVMMITLRWKDYLKVRVMLTQHDIPFVGIVQDLTLEIPEEYIKFI